jgi:tetratricopeptide (TPR) repeat protein
MRGDVTEISRTEIVLKGRTNKREYRIPANEVERVRWDSESPQLNQLRNDERNGLFDKAIRGYESVLQEASRSALNLRTDVEFLIARTVSAKALSEEDQFDDAIGRLEKFRTDHATSFRYFETLRLLARLYMLKGDVPKAAATMKRMSEAPWTDYKMDADILKARLGVAHGDLANALESLDRVVAIKPANSAETSRRYEALLTKASCLEKQGKFSEAIDVLTNVFNEAAEEDTKTLSETCCRLGDCYQAAGRIKEAIVSYLRVDVLFPKEKTHHAEALYHLSRLFGQDSKPDRAAEAAARLQQLYPRSPWTAKLTVAPK